MKKISIVCFIFLLLVGCTRSTGTIAPSQDATEDLISSIDDISVKLPVGYIPNVQFAPLYVAFDKGYYADEGINLTIDYSMENDNAVLLATNEIQFAVLSGEQVVLARDKDMPLVYVMAWYQQYPVGIVTKASEGITTVAQLEGKKIGLPGLFGASYIGAIALLDSAGLSESDVTLDSIGFNQVELFMADHDDAMVVYSANEPVQLEHLGEEINLLKVSDAVDLVSNGLVTNEETLSNHPELVNAMVEATLKGIQYTINNPEEAYLISEKYVENLADTDKDIQMQVLLNSIDQWKADQLGFSQPSAWENMQRILGKMNLITNTTSDITKCYTNEFVP